MYTVVDEFELIFTDQYQESYIFGGNYFLKLGQREFLFVLGQIVLEHILQMFEVLRRQFRTISRVADVHDEVHHLIDGDGSILVGVGQPKNGGRHTSIAEDLVKGLGGDWVILTDEVGNGLQ